MPDLITRSVRQTRKERERTLGLDRLSATLAVQDQLELTVDGNGFGRLVIDGVAYHDWVRAIYLESRVTEPPRVKLYFTSSAPVGRILEQAMPRVLSNGLKAPNK